MSETFLLVMLAVTFIGMAIIAIRAYNSGYDDGLRAGRKQGYHNGRFDVLAGRPPNRRT